MKRHPILKEKYTVDNRGNFHFITDNGMITYTAKEALQMKELENKDKIFTHAVKKIFKGRIILTKGKVLKI